MSLGPGMALAQGSRRCNAFRQQHISLFHCSASLQEKWRCKYKNRTGYDSDNSHKGSYTSTKPKSQDFRWNRKKVTSKKTNDWEAYLKYEGDWERFCRKFTNLSDFETRRPRSQKERAKKMWHEWDSSDSSDSDDDDDDDDDGWDDDPTFGRQYHKTSRPRVEQTFKGKPVVTVGQRSDRLALGLPPAGSLTMEQLKAAFRASALKWHPDRHQGSTKETAEEKFKMCGNAYRALCSALAEKRA
ncbi:uncharacterized protein LOC9651957 isoform X3 [Selaginella moellendorffii]|uniref:uncharacterized protein LOC9651957 isoform X3 n=1 Tax=Selaginella moellendorffii TaxID=88036 RepID=UPI000D1C97A6|nr:uncharacterized protein LOC9651957 isoform X3 [Selaginella moellendorffii]|eukprot:XP_024517524.1 uncharacterized protein LOC9651957 isoform X3 [Selaginella moellendorffii]